MATYNSAGSGNFNVDATWTESGHPSTGDTAIIASGHTVTMTADDAIGSIDIQGTLTTDGTARTLTLDANADSYICQHRGTVSTTINLVINSDFAGNKLIRLNNGSNGNFNDVSITLESASRVLEFVQNTTIDGNLEILLGKLQPYSSTYDFTVTGRTDIGPASGVADQATLNCSASTVSLGSGRTSSYGLIVNQGGTFAGGSGTHTIGSIETKNNSNAKCTLTSGVTTIDSENTSDNFALSIEAASTFDDGNGTVTFTIGDSTRIRTNTKPLYNVIVNNASASIEYVGDQTIDNDLTVTAGKFRYNSFEDLTVTGDVSVTGILGHPNVGTTSDSTFGSLTINSGGEYKAPSGTTTITSESSAGNAILNNGTFTHNKGTVAIDTDATTQANEGPYYNFKTTRASLDFYPNAALTILNNLDIVGDFDFQNNSHHLTVRGNMTVGDGSTTTRYGQQSANTNNLTVDGVLTILGSATTDLSTHTTVNLGGIRNVGGTIN